MKVLAVLVALVALASSRSVGPIVPDNHTAYGYLKNYGIPEGERIRKAEEELMRGSRIVGGLPASLGQYPYQAGIISDIMGIQGRGVCGGTLISSSRVMTAAHCWYDGQNQAWRVTVVLGSTLLFQGGTRLESSVVAVHPNWFPLLVRNDIAIVYLPSAVPTSNVIAPIALPSQNEASESFAGFRGIASGYGLTKTDSVITVDQFLSHVSLNIITNRACNLAFPTIIQDSHICTSGLGGSGVCSGDSGGPLVVYHNGRNIVVGVTSFGMALGCEVGLPSAYTRVSSFLSFINQHL